MNRSPLLSLLSTAILVTISANHVLAAEPELDWQQANRQRMFVVANDQHRIAAIVVDTSHEQGLRVATRLQELVFRLSGARLPIVDQEFMAVPWGHIHLRWDYYPMQARKKPFEISMRQFDHTSANPSKQIIIAGSGETGMEEAVSAFTKAAFGMPLAAIDDKKFVWQPRATLAIPEDFKVQ
jgi:hypothetical protein